MRSNLFRRLQFQGSVGTLFIAASMCLLAACSQSKFENRSPSSVPLKGNGDYYSGKTYVRYLDELTCTDGGRDTSVIVNDPEQGYLLIRDNCKDLVPPVQIPNSEVDDNITYLVYDNALYLEEEPTEIPPETPQEPRPNTEPPAPLPPRETPPAAYNCIDSQDVIRYNPTSGKYYAEHGCISIIEDGFAVANIEIRHLSSPGLSFADQVSVVAASTSIDSVVRCNFVYLKAGYVRTVSDVSHLMFTALTPGAMISELRNVSHASLWGSVNLDKVVNVSHLYIEKDSMMSLVGKTVSVSHIHLR